MIQEWFKELLIDGIISNLTGMFDTLNTKVGEIAGEVGMTPAAWNSSIFNMIRNLSETVIVPIAGIILTFVMCYELIQLIIEKNTFDIERYMKRRPAIVKPDEPFDLYELKATDLQPNNSTERKEM